MVKKSKWARGSDQYVKRVSRDQSVAGNPAGSESSRILPPRKRSGDAKIQFAACGISWGDFDVDHIKDGGVDRARHRLRSHLPELVWNAAALEGNNFTLPEVKTLLDGVTVGGRKIDDQRQIVALSEAFNLLDELVGSGGFSLTKSVSDELHAIVARHEAIESGMFRGEGEATGGGTVRLARGGVVPGTSHGEGGELLREHYADLVDYLRRLDDPRRRALLYFAAASRRQFYFDGNKRTARLMMAGELMSSGNDVVSVPFARKLEFNNALDQMFETDDATELLRFLGTCTLD